MFDNASARQANIVLPLEGYTEKDGDGHPPRRARAAAARARSTSPKACGSAGTGCSSSQPRWVRPRDLDNEPELFAALTDDVAIYEGHDA